MDTGQSTSANEKREGERLSPTEPTHPTMRQSGTFEAFGNAEQRLYVRSGSRLATEIQSDFGTATYWSTFESGDGSSRRGNMRPRAGPEIMSGESPRGKPEVTQGVCHRPQETSPRAAQVSPDAAAYRGPVVVHQGV